MSFAQPTCRTQLTPPCPWESLCPPWSLRRATRRAQPRLYTHSGNGLLDPGGSDPHSPALSLRALPLRLRPSRQIPGGSRRGGGGPARRPAPPGSQSGLCLRQPGAQRSRRGPGLSRGPGRGGEEVQRHRRRPGTGRAAAGDPLRLRPTLRPASDGRSSRQPGPGPPGPRHPGRTGPSGLRRRCLSAWDSAEPLVG